MAPHRKNECDGAAEDVDRIVLAPPGADVDDGRVEEDREPTHHGPTRRRAQMPRDQRSKCQVGDARRCFHDLADRRVRGRRHGPERRVYGREQAPDVDHHRREGQVLVIGPVERRGRKAVDPENELVEITGETGRRPEGNTQGGRHEEADPEHDGLARWPPHDVSGPARRCHRRLNRLRSRAAETRPDCASDRGMR